MACAILSLGSFEIDDRANRQYVSSSTPPLVTRARGCAYAYELAHGDFGSYGPKVE